MTNYKLNPEQRAAFRRLHEAATPAPWNFEIGSFDKGYGNILYGDGDKYTSAIIISHLHSRRDEANYRLIAEVRNALPKLLDTLDAAEAVVQAAFELRNSGYDGPFIGEVCEPLFLALAAYEKASKG